jgi:glycerol-3-phosphate acyltransferase PlsX
MRIAVDAMGGDFAPDEVIKGVLNTASKLADSQKIILIGQQERLGSEVFNHPKIEIVHAPTVIEMGEHPAKAFASKQDSSIAIGFHLLATKKVDAFCSAGNTGAMMAGSMLVLKPIPGIIRPAIAGYVPKSSGAEGTLLDVGANADCKPEMLAQFGMLGHLYAKYVLGIQVPKVGLLSLGEEESKGTIITKEAFQLLKANNSINFIGNIEGRDIFNEKADVIICDGYVGNVITKMAEHIYEILAERGIKDDFLEKLNYEGVGGSPIIGVNGNVIIGHGVSNARAIEKMIMQSIKLAESNINNIITAALQETVNQIND